MSPIPYLFASVTLFVLLADNASAEGRPLFTERELQSGRSSVLGAGQGGLSSLGGSPQPLIQAHAEVPGTTEAEDALGSGQSLFIGQATGGLFAPMAPRDGSSADRVVNGYGSVRGSDPQIEMIRDLIAQAEAGPAGYDAVQYGARRRPTLPPTQMTLGDIFAWIEATPNQPHAIGRYQFIPSTLARLVNILGAGPNERFSPHMQDRLADILLQEAGLAAYRSGEMTRHQLMNNLTQIWAGLPNSSGRSHYHGYAGNAATMTWSHFDSEMTRIFEG